MNRASADGGQRRGGDSAETSSARTTTFLATAASPGSHFPQAPRDDSAATFGIVVLVLAVIASLDFAQFERRQSNTGGRTFTVTPSRSGDLRR